MKANEAHAELLRSLEGLEQEVLDKPMAPGKWPIRDMLAHLIYWNQWCLDYVRKRLAGEHPGEFPDTGDCDRINAEAAEQWAGHSPEQLVEELERIHRETITLMEKIGPEGLREKCWDRERETEIGKFFDGFAAHQLYHCKQIRRWREASGL